MHRAKNHRGNRSRRCSQSIPLVTIVILVSVDLLTFHHQNYVFSEFDLFYIPKKIKDIFYHWDKWIFINIFFFQRIGCDGIAGSDAILDQCGICNGDGSTCQLISGIFTRRYLSYGYNLISRIPAGACNINITEMSRSRNVLGKRKLSLFFSPCNRLNIAEILLLGR